jgi:hypothetical protein
MKGVIVHIGPCVAQGYKHDRLQKWNFVANSAKFRVQLNVLRKTWYPTKAKPIIDPGPIYTMARDHDDDGGAQNTSKGDPMKI